MAESASPQHPGRDKAPAAVTPYGLWPSPIDGEQVARQATAYDAVHTSGEAVYWLETRPSQDGRAVVVRWTDDAGAADAVPARFDVGSRVHEYGGGAYLPAGRTLFACNQGDQRLYRIDGQRDPVPITPVPPTPASLRYADLRLMSSGALLVCVRERHQGALVVNELVALPTDGSAEPWVVASGHDFYAAPRPSPDGRRLAWLTWDRPCMPWDGADLWVADLGPDGRLGPASHVVGGPHESVVQPEWNPEGVLHFVSDRTGWWNLYRERHGQVESLLPMAAEFADAPRELDYSSYAFITDGRIACRYRQQRPRPPRPARPPIWSAHGPADSVHLAQALPSGGRRSPGVHRRQRHGQLGRGDPSCANGSPRRPGRGRGFPGPGLGVGAKADRVPGPGRPGRPTPSITRPPTLRSPGRRLPGRRRCWCRPIPDRPPTPRPA